MAGKTPKFLYPNKIVLFGMKDVVYVCQSSTGLERFLKKGKHAEDVLDDLRSCFPQLISANLQELRPSGSGSANVVLGVNKKSVLAYAYDYSRVEDESGCVYKYERKHEKKILRDLVQHNSLDAFTGPITPVGSLVIVINTGKHGVYEEEMEEYVRLVREYGAQPEVLREAHTGRNSWLHIPNDWRESLK